MPCSEHEGHALYISMELSFMSLRRLASRSVVLILAMSVDTMVLLSLLIVGERKWRGELLKWGEHSRDRNEGRRSMGIAEL